MPAALGCVSHDINTQNGDVLKIYQAGKKSVHGSGAVAPATFVCLCRVYVMGDTAQSRMHASRPAYDPHCLQRHILEHLVPNAVFGPGGTPIPSPRPPLADLKSSSLRADLKSKNEIKKRRPRTVVWATFSRLS